MIYGLALPVSKSWGWIPQPGLPRAQVLGTPGSASQGLWAGWEQLWDCCPCPGTTQLGLALCPALPPPCLL